MAQRHSDDQTVGSSDKAGYPERGCHPDSHYTPVTRRGCLKACSRLKPAQPPSAFHTPFTPPLFFFPVIRGRTSVLELAAVRSGMVGRLAPDSGSGPRLPSGPRTPHPARLLPDQAIPGALLSL